LKRIFLLSIAAVSAIALLGAARRPHYGGTLRIETNASPADASASPFAGLVYETLIRFDEKGDLQPSLAISWTHDAARKRWVFTPRTGVTLHNGSPWNPGALEFPDDRPIEDFARAARAIVIHTPEGQSMGTGPFHVTKWEAGKQAVLAANDSYWGARPFLDSVEIQMNRAARDQALDFDLGKADVVDAAPSELRHLRQRGVAIVSSRNCELIALAVEGNAGDALAFSIDREAIRNVILQGAGESTGAILPPWLTGYAFLFPFTRDIARARATGGTATFSVDGDDAILRAIGERIVLNAEEAGIHLRPGTNAGVRLMRLPITEPNAALALSDIADTAKITLPPGGALDSERSLIASRRVIPLFHLPLSHAVGLRVHDFRLGATGRWHLEDVWVGGEHP